jgi:hypothetical protein
MFKIPRNHHDAGDLFLLTLFIGCLSYGEYGWKIWLDFLANNQKLT